MSEHTKEHPTSKDAHILWQGSYYSIPFGVLEKYRDHGHSETVSIDEVFSSELKTMGEPGILLKGLRTREGKSQTAFAQMIGVTQTNLSAMENGRRTIGKAIAQRIAEQFDVNYRLFL